MASEGDYSITERILRCVEQADWEGLADCYARDVLPRHEPAQLAVPAPGPRRRPPVLFQQTKGLTNLRCTQHRVYPIADGIIVEEEMRFDGDEGECLWRAVDIFHIAGDAVVEHGQYCTGCWTPADVSRHAAEAPMVRW